MPSSCAGSRFSAVDIVWWSPLLRDHDNFIGNANTGISSNVIPGTPILSLTLWHCRSGVKGPQRIIKRADHNLNGVVWTVRPGGCLLINVICTGNRVQSVSFVISGRNKAVERTTRDLIIIVDN